jgi:two-component system, OmpR family, phosphate regulon response regulator OmpR
MNHDKPHILVVDDDDRLRALLRKYLSDQGFMVTASADAADARRKLAHFLFDLVVLDVMMPGESGLDLLASLRKNPREPVLMLSAMGEAEDRIRGLETGAEDYLSKPFEPKELVLRIRSILRRQAAEPEKSGVLGFGDYRFEPATGRLQLGGEAIYLTSSEAAMLKRLAEQAGNPVSREDLASLMSGGSERSVDVQINRLRRKIEDGAGRPQHIQTVRGKGYVLYAAPVREGA